MSTDTNIQTIEDAPRALSTQAAPASPADMVMYVMKNGGTIEQLREFMQLQREMEADQARKAFVADMAAFKRNPPTIVKDKFVGYENRDGTRTGYSHATLGNVTNAIVQGLAEHGFSHNWDVTQEGTLAKVTCKITHRMGHSESVSMQANKDDSGKKNPIQQVASAISYLQRYTLLAATGLATHDENDNDGAGAAALNTKIADKWIAAALGATSASALQKVWADGEADIAANGTDFDRNDLVQAIEDRKNQLVKMASREPTKSSRLKDIVGAGAAGEES